MLHPDDVDEVLKKRNGATKLPDTSIIMDQLGKSSQRFEKAKADFEAGRITAAQFRDAELDYQEKLDAFNRCLLYTSPSPRD